MVYAAYSDMIKKGTKKHAVPAPGLISCGHDKKGDSDMIKRSCRHDKKGRIILQSCYPSSASDNDTESSAVHLKPCGHNKKGEIALHSALILSISGSVFLLIPAHRSSCRQA